MTAGLSGDRPLPLCLVCQHFDLAGPGMACTAFPGGIPLAISESRADHRQPYAGDGGIRFALRPGATLPAQYARGLRPEPGTNRRSKNVD